MVLGTIQDHDRGIPKAINKADKADEAMKPSLEGCQN